MLSKPTASLISASILVCSLALTSCLDALQQPNVVIVITDDQGYGDLSCHGNPILKTPNLDTLHAESVRLVDYHVAPTCSPTRSGLLTGHWTNRTGAWHTIMGRSLLRENEVTMGQVFNDAGYATGMFGKWHLGDNYPFRPEDRGFTEVMRHGSGGVGQTPDYWDNAYFDGSYWHNGTPTPVKGYCTDVFFDYAKQFIRDQKTAGKPFLAYISTNAPHGPMHAPEKFSEPYMGQGKRVANFLGMIANIDDNVGQLRDFLKQEGLAENTIFIFTTDNGTAAGDKIFNANMRGKKGSPYDGGHRVPFFVSWPKAGLNTGRDVKPITSYVDILPTLIDMCQVPPPQGVKFDGQSIKSLLSGQEDAKWDQRILVTDSQRVRDPKKWKSSSVMTSRWRLINGKELYDMDVDSGQQTDVAQEHPAVVAKLTEFYETWWTELQPTFADDALIYIGHARENPASLTSHDCIQGTVAWNQAQIRRGVTREKGSSAVWNVKVAEDGEYEFRLRRWPQEADLPITASLAAGADVPGDKAFRTNPGAAISVTKAFIKIAGESSAADVSTDDKEIIMELKLKAGPTQLERGSKPKLD